MMYGLYMQLHVFKDKYSKSVVFAGFKTGNELAMFFAAADVLVFTSKTDTFGNVMIESMACGTPVA
jgi:glycosyltransferase involved in cell wall biosynthesis